MYYCTALNRYDLFHDSNALLVACTEPVHFPGGYGWFRDRWNDHPMAVTTAHGVDEDVTYVNNKQLQDDKSPEPWRDLRKAHVLQLLLTRQRRRRGFLASHDPLPPRPQASKAGTADAGGRGQNRTGGNRTGSGFGTGSSSSNTTGTVIGTNTSNASSAPNSAPHGRDTLGSATNADSGRGGTAPTPAPHAGVGATPGTKATHAGGGSQRRLRKLLRIDPTKRTVVYITTVGACVTKERHKVSTEYRQFV